MDKLDTLVTQHIADRLLNTERLTAMLASLASRRATKAAAVDMRIGTLEKEVHDAAALYRSAKRTFAPSSTASRSTIM